MSPLIRIVLLLCLCIWGTGCIEEHAFSTDNEAPLPPEGPPTDLPPECDIENPECDDGQICVVVPRCISGHVLTDDEVFEQCLPGSYVCDEHVRRPECVQPLSINDECRPYRDRCGDGLACQVDTSQRCRPQSELGACIGRDSGWSCLDVYTCQPPRPPCDVVGEIEACSCAGGAMGARYCGHDLIWSACDGCDAPPRFGPDDGQCYRCLNDASGPVECSGTVDHSSGTLSCVVGDGVPDPCWTVAQCCMTLGRKIDSSGTCALPDSP